MTDPTPPRLPALFLPHGGGPSFFMAGERKAMWQPMEDFLRQVPALLPATPTAILIVTAHWEADPITLTGGVRPELIYDYYGFPPETYQLRYDAPGEPALAQRAAALLNDHGLTANVDPAYGWDHGVFIPLKVIYPNADIPVVAMSLKTGLDPALHCQAGRALSSLRDDGVLIIGSGMSYHNLRNFAAAAPASFTFEGWLDGALTGSWQTRTEQLAQWHRAPGGRQSHPREEHLIPLMVASGAGGDAPGRRMWQGPVGPSVASGWWFD